MGRSSLISPPLKSRPLLTHKRSSMYARPAFRELKVPPPLPPFIVLIINSYTYVWRRISANNGALLVPIGIPRKLVWNMVTSKTDEDIIDKTIRFARVKDLYMKNDIYVHCLIIFSKCTEIVSGNEAFPSLITYVILQKFVQLRCFNFSCEYAGF